MILYKYVQRCKFLYFFYIAEKQNIAISVFFPLNIMQTYFYLWFNIKANEDDQQMPRTVQHEHWSFLFSIYLLSSVNSACPDMCRTRSHGDVCNDPPCTRITCTCAYLSSCISPTHREPSLGSCQTTTQSRSSTAQRKMACLRATLSGSLARKAKREREKKSSSREAKTWQAKAHSSSSMHCEC